MNRPALRPFFTYFGGKYRLAPRYPKPEHKWLIEPFAGSAGYALRHPERRVLLIERSPAIAGIWRYLTRVSAAEVRRLPLLEPGQSVDSLDIPEEARWLLGMWVNSGSAQPKKTMGNWRGSLPRHIRMCRWSPHVRERIAIQLDAIRHWVIREGSYTDAPDIEASWFVDPPYIGMGRHYPHGSRGVDYAALGAWCRSRPGQVIVCENTGADWLPFEHFHDAKAKTGISKEAIWTRS